MGESKQQHPRKGESALTSHRAELSVGEDVVDPMTWAGAVPVAHGIAPRAGSARIDGSTCCGCSRSASCCCWRRSPQRRGYATTSASRRSSPTTPARSRVPLATAAAKRGVYRRWRFLSMDGTAIDAADTPAIAEVVGRAGTGRGDGSAFPQLFAIDDPGRPGATDTKHRLITTILDPTAAPADELAALYAQRWEIESIYAEFKTHHRGPVSRCGPAPPKASTRKRGATCACITPYER